MTTQWQSAEHVIAVIVLGLVAFVLVRNAVPFAWGLVFMARQRWRS